MKKILFIIPLLMMFMFTNSQSKNFIDQPYVQTFAEVDTLVVPDRIFLSIDISEGDTKGKLSVDDLADKMAQALEMIGIDLQKQLVLLDLSSNFKKYFLKKQDIVKKKSFELLVYDAKTAGRVITDLDNIGISNIELERTERSDFETIKLELKSKAILRAKEQCQYMVKPLNQKLGKAIYIRDIKYSTNVAGIVAGIVAGYSSKKKSNKASDYKPIPIEFKKIKIESEVEIKFILE